jgi:hypothetical protein
MSGLIELGEGVSVDGTLGAWLCLGAKKRHFQSSKYYTPFIRRYLEGTATETPMAEGGMEVLLNKSLERTRDMFIDSNPYVPRPFEPR